MKITAPILAVIAGLSLTACVTEDGAQKVAPAAPTVTSGAIDAPDSLNGDWNLVAAQCGQAGSKGALKISGNHFDFSEASCVSTQSSVQTNFTSVSLSCKGGTKGFNRQLNLALKPGQMRMTEDTKTLTYYRCPLAVVKPGEAAVVNVPTGKKAVVKTAAGDVITTAPGAGGTAAVVVPKPKM